MPPYKLKQHMHKFKDVVKTPTAVDISSTCYKCGNNFQSQRLLNNHATACRGLTKSEKIRAMTAVVKVKTCDKDPAAIKAKKRIALAVASSQRKKSRTNTNVGSSQKAKTNSSHLEHPSVATNPQAPMQPAEVQTLSVAPPPPQEDDVMKVLSK